MVEVRVEKVLINKFSNFLPLAKSFKTFLGSNNVCSVHEWKGVFRNENVLFKMTSVCGHVMSLDFVGMKYRFFGSSTSSIFNEKLKFHQNSFARQIQFMG